MGPVSTETAGIQSELPDLGNVSIAMVRTLDSAAFRHALHLVMEQAGRPIKTETSCSQAARFD